MVKKCLIIVFMFWGIIFSIGTGYAENLLTEEPLVTMLLFETDLREALSEISLQTGVPIIPDQTVGGLITVDLQEVPLEKALHMILISGGYTFKKFDDFYLVGLSDPQNTTFGELSELEVVVLNHITVNKVFELIPDFLKNYIQGNRESNLLTINAPARELKRIKNLIQQIDLPQQQIEVQVVVTEVDSSVIRELGINLLNFTETDQQTETWFNYSLDSNLFILETNLYGKLFAELKMLEEEQKASIEADPKVLLTDGSTAELFVGEQQIMLIESQDSTTRLEEFEVGVGLKVTAKIIGQNQLILQITPSVSHYLGKNNNSHIIRENTVSTTLQLKDGQTVVLAGMTILNNSMTINKVPLLGNIPIIRWLFKTEKKSNSDREFLVFVTPTIR